MIGLGGFIGDMCGSPYTYNNVKDKNFKIFSRTDSSDKTILLWAEMDWLVNNGKSVGDLENTLKEFVKKYPRAGYDSAFFRWATGKDDNRIDSNACSVVRSLPLMIQGKNIIKIEKSVRDSICVTNNKEQVLHDGRAFTNAMFLAKIGIDKNNIKNKIQKDFDYELGLSVDELKNKRHPLTTDSSVIIPEALNCFFESTDFESAIHNAIYIGGDSALIATLTGALAEIYYGIPLTLIEKAMRNIPDELRDVIQKYETIIW